jgi:UDP-N-acetylmuramoyl-tripeptide--D-alanyl-D-alanine ligase
MVKCTIDDRGCATANVASPWGEVELKMQVAGRHMAHNALAALCVAGALGIDMGAASSAVSSAKISEFRMQMRKLQSGATVIDDSYNANPASMRAALETLASIDAKRKVAFCGLMAELADSAKEHQAIRQYATGLGIELVAVNTDLYDVDAVSFDQARDQLAKLGRDDAALVKGSKVTGLVRLCEGL